MKLGDIVLAIGLVGLVLAALVCPIAAQGAEATPKQNLEEAQKNYSAHNYEAALNRLQQIKRADLGFFEKGTYDALLAKTDKAVKGKAADQKAFTEGKEALNSKQYAAALPKLSQAASSEYLGDQDREPAKALLQLATDGHTKALDDVRKILAQAGADAKAGKTADARAKVQQVQGLNLQFAPADQKTIADLNKAIVDAEAKAAKAAQKPPVAVAVTEVKPAQKPPVAVAVTEVKPVEKPAAKPAEKPAVKPPAKPAGPTASDLLAEAKKKYGAGDYAAAQKGLAQVDKSKLGMFEKWSYDSLAGSIQKAIAGRAAGEKALVEGKDALAKKKYTAAMTSLSQAADSPYLPAEQAAAAKAASQMAQDEHGRAVADAGNLVAKANASLADGKPADARKTVDQIKAMDVDLGWWAGADLKRLDKRVTSVEAAMVAAAAKPAPKPVEKVAAKPVEKPVVKVAAKPVEKPVVKVAAKPVEKPVVKVAAKPVEAPAEKPAPKPAEPPVDLAAQARRAEAEDETKLGDEALANHEYEKAKIHFGRARSLWPDSAKAKAGLDQALKLLAEREEPLGDVVRDVRNLERQRIIASVQELVAQAERDMGRATRAEDYTECLRPLSQADRTIDVAPVLSAEEQERLREQVLVLRKEIQKRKADAEGKRAVDSQREATEREKQRREADRVDRGNKVRQLWERATELRKSMQFAEAIEVLDRLVAVDPNDERALRWREDLLYLEAQSRQVNVRTARESGAVEALTDAEEAAIHPGEKVRGVTTYLRYPEAKAWKDLTEFRRDFTKAVSAEPKAVAETRRRLSEQIDLDFEKTSLDNVLKYISEVQRGLNIVIDPDVSTAGIDLSTRVVDLKVKRVAVESVLGLILGADLGYRVESGYILVTTREKLQQNLPVVTYPVQDLVAQIPDFGGEAPRFEVGDVIQAAAAAAGGGGVGDLFGGATTTATDQPVGWQELVDIIQRTVNNQSDPNVAAWSDEGGPAAIEFMNGLLIVTQTRKGHERVADLLEQLRRERAIMISVESRFCTVTDEFLQDITLDIDAAFVNTGNNRFLPPAGTVIQDSGSPGPLPAGYDTLPGIPAGGDYPLGSVAQPIIISGTGSNGIGTQTLLSGVTGGTAFGSAGWSDNPNQGGMVLSGVFLDDIQIGFLLRAIQADIRSTTLQAPRITLYNGQRSYISVSTVTTYVSDVEPVVAEAAVGWDPTIGAIPVGVTLDVKATVSADRRYVQMDLRPQVATIEGWDSSIISAAVPMGGIATATIDLPRVRVQDFKTTVSVPDGGTLLLGGTRQYIEGEAETGVPILSKIPILKRLFNNRATLRFGNNLLILMRPKIIIQAEEESKLGYDNF